MWHNPLSWPVDAVCWQTMTWSFSELNPDGRNLTAYKVEMVWMFLHSVEGPLFPATPSPPPMSDYIFSSCSYIKFGKGERRSSLGEIGLWRIASAHSEAILSSDEYNELELWVLLSLPLMIPPSEPPPKTLGLSLNILNGSTFQIKHILEGIGSSCPAALPLYKNHPHRMITDFPIKCFYFALL